MRPRPDADLSQMDDGELVRRFQQGIDPDGAFMALFHRHGSMTYGFFRRRTGSAETAAELNQDLYMTVLQHLSGFREESAFRTWLFRIAHNSLSHLRRRWRTHLDERGDEVPEALWERLADEGLASQEEEVARRQCAQALRLCLARLPETERAVILGNYFEGVTLAELSRRLEMDNPSGARASQIAALRKLKRCLETEGIHGAA